MKKILSLLLAIVMVFCIMPFSALPVHADTYIRNMSVSYDARAVAARPDLTGREVTKLLQNALYKATVSDGIHIDVSSSCLAKRTGSGMISYVDFEKLDQSDELLSGSGEYYFIINTEENDGYGYDTGNLPAATVNGSSCPVSWYDEDCTRYDGSVDILQRVYVTNGDYVCGVDVEPKMVKIQRDHDHTLDVEVKGTDSRVTWSFPDGKEDSSTGFSGNTLHIGSNEETGSLRVRATSVYNPNFYDDIYVEVTDYVVEITEVIVTPKTVSVKKGTGFTFDVEVKGTDYTGYECFVTGGTKEETRTFGCTLAISPEETAETLIFTAVSTVDRTKYAQATVTVLPQDVITDPIEISYEQAGLELLTPDMTGKDVSDLLKNALKYANVNKSVHIDINCCSLLKKTGTGMVRYLDFADLSESDEPLEPGCEYYFDINLEENGGFVFPEHLPGAIVNGRVADAVSWYDENNIGPLGSIDVLVKAKTQWDTSEGVRVIPYPAWEFTKDTDYYTDGQLVKVRYEIPCKVGYYSGDRYIACPLASSSGGWYSFNVPEGVSDVILVIKGDVDISGEFDFFDVIMSKAMDLHPEDPYSPVQMFAADVDDDDEFGFFDVILTKAADLGKTPFSW